MGILISKFSQTSAVSHLLSGQPLPADRLSGRCVHGSSSIPAIRMAVKQRLAKLCYRSYSIGRMIEKPAHMMIVNGMPTRMKSENL